MVDLFSETKLKATRAWVLQQDESERLCRWRNVYKCPFDLFFISYFFSPLLFCQSGWFVCGLHSSCDWHKAVQPCWNTVVSNKRKVQWLPCVGPCVNLSSGLESGLYPEELLGLALQRSERKLLIGALQRREQWCVWLSSCVELQPGHSSLLWQVPCVIFATEAVTLPVKSHVFKDSVQGAQTPKCA